MPSPESWKPVGIDAMEPAADEATRLLRNTLVVAGPGAGKTELLAQRACFLLETRACLPPHRILAISFKRDAAKNLAERVRRRCGERAARFESYTLDCFAKGLVDRFRCAIPEEWRPKMNYGVLPGAPSVRELRDWFGNVATAEAELSLNPAEWKDDKIKRGFAAISSSQRIPYDSEGLSPVVKRLGLRWWKEMLALPEGTPALTFPMISRLAEFLLRENPRIIAAMRATYSFVFLDEFQDTTGPQYDLVKTAFLGSPSVLTVVGDDKQRIMAWAGAMPNAFGVFGEEFSAERRELLCNYRSAPELVAMQHTIASAIASGTPPARATRQGVSGSCAIWEFSDPAREASDLATVIQEGLSGGMTPRDFCVVVRQKTAQIIEPLRSELAARQIRLRDESELQDLLVEPVVDILLAVLRLATRARDPEAWDILSDHLGSLLGIPEGDKCHGIERMARSLTGCARDMLQRRASGQELGQTVIHAIGEERLKSCFLQYAQGGFMQERIETFGKALDQALTESGAPQVAVDRVIGRDAVPAMTIHKCKGLEFKTVIFVGLEDAQWWSYRADAEEGKRVFFVAFSRAISRVIFTFCDSRPGGYRPEQTKRDISELYLMLREAGVVTEDHRS